MQLRDIPGVADHGLFLGLIHTLLIAHGITSRKSNSRRRIDAEPGEIKLGGKVRQCPDASHLLNSLPLDRQKKCSVPSDPDSFGGNRFEDLLQRSSSDSVELNLAFKV